MGVPVIYTDFDDEDGGRAARNGHSGHPSYKQRTA